MVSAESPLVIPGIISGWKSAALQITAAKESTTTNTSVASRPHQIPRSSPHTSRKGNRTAPSGDIKGSLSAIFPRRGWGLHYAAAWRKIKCLLFDWAKVKMHPPSPLLPHDEAFFFCFVFLRLRKTLFCLSVCFHLSVEVWWSGLLDCSSSDNQRPRRASVCEL